MSAAILLFLIVAIIGLSTTVLWILALIHLVRNERLDSTTKAVWVLAIVFFPVVGSIVYLIAGRGQSQRVA